ncbi:hypothetical protein KEJ45_04845 [Candidatus Bathyarchaeota archaeon]|nr:hypothetical protein [Candidatus Bathyarchaeota archaeon]
MGKDKQRPWASFDMDKPHTEGEPMVRQPGTYSISPTKTPIHHVDMELTKPNKLKRGE